MFPNRPGVTQVMVPTQKMSEEVLAFATADQADRATGPREASEPSIGIWSTTATSRTRRCRIALLIIWAREAGSSMWPARSRNSISLRHTMSGGSPLGWTQFHSSHNCAERRRRLDSGCAAMNWRIWVISSARISRPR